MTLNAEDLVPYVERVTRRSSWRSIAVATGIEPSTLTRQFNRGRVPATTVIAIARAFGGDLLEGLVIGGFITEDEATGMASRGALRSASDLQLAVEIMRRTREGSVHDRWLPGDREGEFTRLAVAEGEPATYSSDSRSDARN